MIDESEQLSRRIAELERFIAKAQEECARLRGLVAGRDRSEGMSHRLNEALAACESYRLDSYINANDERLKDTDVRSFSEICRRVGDLGRIISSIGDGVVIYDERGVVLHINQAAERIFGHSMSMIDSQAVVGNSLVRIETPEGDLFPEDSLPARRAIRGEPVVGEVMVLVHLDGRRIWTSVSATPLFTPSGELAGAIEITTDITQLQEIQKRREDLVHTISHDLRNPLTSIYGQAQLLQKMLSKLSNSDRLRWSVDAILTSAKRMNAMIQDLVDSTRLESGQLVMAKQPIDLEHYLNDVLERANDVLAVHRVRTQIPSKLPQIEADPNRLERIFYNLLSNALKYSPEDSEVLIRIEQESDRALISIVDKGAGIAPEDARLLFQRFYRASSARKSEGLGLGLYITRMLVEAHNGQIWVESEPGNGSCFTFTLPIKS